MADIVFYYNALNVAENLQPCEQWHFNGHVYLGDLTSVQIPALRGFLGLRRTWNTGIFFLLGAVTDMENTPNSI